jgi:hypothetical protein
VIEHPCDDPYCYFCNRDGGYVPDLPLQVRIDCGTKMLTEGEPSPETKAFLQRDEDRESWMIANEVPNGTVCDWFKQKEQS